MLLRNNAPLSYLEVEFWEDGKWHGACYRHRPLPGPNNDIPRYLLHVTTNDGYDDPREAAKAIMAAFPHLPSPLDGITDEELERQVAEAKKLIPA